LLPYLLNILFQEKLGDNGVLLYPSHPFPAVYHYSSILRPYNFGYWAIFNVLKLPVTQIPMGLSKDGLPVGIQVHFIVRLKLTQSSHGT
jgi:fatty acid amide hydrolase 2